MPVWKDRLSGSNVHDLVLTVNLVSQNVANNTSRVSVKLELDHVSGSPGSWYGGSSSWADNVGGARSGNTTYDFRNNLYGSKTLDSFTRDIPHNSNGTLTLTVTASWSTSGSIGNASISESWTLPTIPRASTVTFDLGTTFDVGQTVRINTNRASSSFTHVLELWEYGVGASSPLDTLDTDAQAYYDWAVPESMATYFPDTTSKKFFIRCKTYNGGTLIGTKDVVFTLTAPATMVPTISSISTQEMTAKVISAAIGGFVQGQSSVKFTVNASGPQGASITVSEFTINDATYPSGTAVPMTISGTRTVSARVVDSRGRSKTYNMNISVLAYSPPNVNTLKVERTATSNGTPTNNGSYLKVTLGATIQSLSVGGSQKNAMTIIVKVKERGAAGDPTVRKTINHGTLTYALSSFALDGGAIYLPSKSWEVTVEVHDKLRDQTSILTIATEAVLMHWTSDNNVSIGKLWTQGKLDVAGDIYQNNNLVLDASSRSTNAETQSGSSSTKLVTPASLASRTATETRTGLSEIATTAETLTGDDDTRIVTPAKLKNRLLLPAAQEYYGNGVISISATSWADISGFSLEFTFARPCRVLIVLNAWIATSAGELRAGVAASGAGAFSPVDIGWGTVFYASPAETAGTRQRSASFTRDVPAGTTTFKARAYQTGGGTNQFNYGYLQVTPLAWLD